MPKVTMYFKNTSEGSAFPHNFYNRLEQAGMVIRDSVARAASTSEVQLERKDVDFIPIPYPRGSLVDLPVSIEIETIVYPERKEKMTERVLDQLKDDIFVALDHVELTRSPFWDIDRDSPLIWLKYVDPDGLHI